MAFCAPLAGDLLALMHPRLRTPLCELLGSDAPVIQTGMGWVATPELVAASCNAGAFGILAAATIPAPEVEAAIRRTRALTDRPFGVNFLMEQPGAERIADAIVRNGVRLASYSRAPRAELIRRFKDAGILCVPTVGAVRHAVKAVELGADALIVQGGEGGGHTGSVPTSLLVPQVVDAVRVPVAAAGGIRDGRGLVAALALGAQGIAMGTRFMLTAESPVADATKRRYLAASVDDTVVTRRIDGLPQRVIRNELVRALESGSAPRRLLRAVQSALAYRRLSGASVRALAAAGLALRRQQGLSLAQVLLAANAPVLVRAGVVEGETETGVLPTGQVVGLVTDLPTCAELMARLLLEADRTLDSLCGAASGEEPRGWT